MQDEPELLIPISQLQQPAPAPVEPSGWRMALWRAWIVVGVVTVGPCAFAALFVTNSGSAGDIGAVLFLAWLFIAWIVKPLLR